KFTDEASGIEVAPQEIDVEVKDDGSFEVSGIDVTVPIFLPTGGHVLLPLKQVNVKTLPGKGLTDNDGKPSKNGNCIGNYRTDLKPGAACLPEDDISFFENGAELAGYITVEDAEGVWIADMKTSLCVLLGQKNEYKEQREDGTHCKRDEEG